MQALSEASEFSKLNQRFFVPRSLNSFHNLSARSKTSNNLRNSKLFPLDNKLTSKSDYNFKYITESELEAALKRVRRAKQKRQDEEEWMNFLRSKQEISQDKTPEDSICEFCKPTNTGNRCEGCHLPELASSSHGLSRQLEEEGSRGEKEEDPAPAVALDSSGINENLGRSSTYQLAPGLTKRLQDLLATVGKMTSLILNPCQCEDEDVDRIIKRSLEFDSMFARNHLYEIQRVLKDNKKLASTRCSTADLETKISAALKSVTQALQVYARHVSKGVPVKYQQVVPIFQSISSTQGLLEQLTGTRLFPLRQELDVACSYMKQILLEASGTERRTVTVSTVSRKPRVRRKNRASADLSMYNRRHWRGKAGLARSRLPPPSAKKQVQTKESVSAKEVPFRNSTRAVPEEHVTTMMEMIPREPLDEGEGEICLDDNTFQALKLLNGAHPPTWRGPAGAQPVQVEAGPARQASCGDVQPEPALRDQLKPESSSYTKSSARSKSVDKESGRPASAKSSARPARSASNVRLVCLTEAEAPNLPLTRSAREDKSVMLTIEGREREEVLEYRQKIIDLQTSSSQYKDGKAVGIVDRLTNRILTEMLLDFQRDEIDQVIRILYNLEFE